MGNNWRPVVVREFTVVQDSDVKHHIGQRDIDAVAGLEAALAERVVSRPETGAKQRQIFNIVWDTVNEEVIVEISETDS